jgi:hypothetical protein
VSIRTLIDQDENLSPEFKRAFAEVFNIDYTPEERAIEAEERAAAEAIREREERAEREAEQPYDRTVGEWGGL